MTICTRHRWDNGFAAHGYAEEIEEAGEVTPRTFTFRTDWPPEAGGRNSGPSPGEVSLGALGGRVAMAYITKAAMRVWTSRNSMSPSLRPDLRGGDHGGFRLIRPGSPRRRQVLAGSR